MTIQQVEKQVYKFLGNEESEAISISGHWGVGKTYAWEKYIARAHKSQEIGLSNYSYVSLFGINSISELKIAIFENMISTEIIGTQPSIQTVSSSLYKLGKEDVSVENFENLKASENPRLVILLPWPRDHLKTLKAYLY